MNQYLTDPTPWRHMLINGSASTSYQIPTPATAAPATVDASSPLTANVFIKPKGKSSLVQQAFLAATGDSGSFDVLVFGMSRLNADGKFLASQIAELNCTIGSLASIPGGDLGTDWLGVDEITKTAGADSIVIDNLNNQLAHVTIDVTAHEYIGWAFKTSSGHTMNGLWKGL